MDSVYSQRVRAGKRRTYFFDVKETRGNDYFLTITESRRKFNEDGYDRHKIFLYKEDFNKFLKGMTEAIDFVKTELMPDFDFDIFSHENDENYQKPEPIIREDIAQDTQDIQGETENKQEETSNTPESSATQQTPEQTLPAVQENIESSTPATEEANEPLAPDNSEDSDSPAEGSEPDTSHKNEEADKW